VPISGKFAGTGRAIFGKPPHAKLYHTSMAYISRKFGEGWYLRWSPYSAPCVRPLKCGVYCHFLPWTCCHNNYIANGFAPSLQFAEGNDPIWQDICSKERAVESDIIPAFKRNTAQEPSYSLSETSNINVTAATEHSHAQELISELLASDQSNTSQPSLPSTCAFDLPLSEAPV